MFNISNKLNERTSNYKKIRHSVISIAVFSCSIFLTACGSSSDNDKATLNLSITDAPVDGATSVIVEFTGVEIKGSNGPAFSVDFNESRQIDLLILQGDSSEALITDLEIEPGSYQWMRLKVNAEIDVLDSTISFDDGSVYSLYIPSGSQTGLKLNNGFTVAAGASANFTIDFDLRKSITNPVGQVNNYFLKPSLRIVDNTQVSKISGTVSSEIMLQQSCADGGVAVYAYTGADVQADDEGSATPPISSALVELNATSGNFEFMLAFLTPADYTVALTCDAELDVAEEDNDIAFIQSKNATTLVNETTAVIFE